MLTNTLRLSLALAFAAALTLAGLTRPRAADAQAANTMTNVTTPVDTILASPCANGGAGELLHITGRVHTLIHSTVNDNHTTVTFHSQAEDVTAVGLTTGDVYRSGGVVRQTDSFQSDGATSETTIIMDVLFLGPGPDNNLVSHSVFHLTFNDNGELTSSHFDFSSECR